MMIDLRIWKLALALFLVVVLVATCIPSSDAAGCTKTASPRYVYANRYTISNGVAHSYGGWYRASVSVDSCHPVYARLAGKGKNFYRVVGAKLYVAGSEVTLR